uniref:PB1 domain-containing protein n=2 Tax=Noccaea caerulescens TaxID=107243 RepID=A0A1J3F173_NOCCA
MDKFSYNSYPDSAESSPRSREVDFDNPPPWEDQQQQQQQTHSYKVKFMCSYGGKIQPRPHDNQLTYVNGETKIMSVDRGTRFPALVSKLSAVCGGGDVGEISFKYQLPGEDLDALISVTNDDDLEHMMHEYDRLLRMSSKPARMRLFLFPSFPISGGFGSEGSTKSDRETLNPIPSRPESEKSVSAPPNNADFLFGSEKSALAPPPPVAVHIPQQMPDPVAIEPPIFANQQVVQPDHGVNPAEMQRQIHEFQRIQIRDQELQQQQQQQMQQQQQQQMQHQHQLQQQQEEEAMYRRKSEDALMETGRYFSPTYAQNPAPTAVPQTNQQPPIGYWQGNNNNNIPGNNMYTTTSQNLPEQQQVYMIPAQSQAPGTLYHSVMRPTAQGNQGYYPPVQRIHHPDAYMNMEQQQSQQGYNVVQPQPQPQYSGGPMGLQETASYSQMGNPVYYTVAGEGMMVQPQQPPPQPQYQGIGQPVNTAPKASQNSDSV